MNRNLTNEEIKIFEQTKTLLGAPLRKIELTNNMLCNLLDMAIEEYSQYLNEWLIENSWTSVFGKSASQTDIATAITTRELNFEAQFSYAYSKQVGLQSRGPWQLKKDYIDIVDGRQVYEIPAGREVNQVLWVTPPTVDSALYGYWSGGSINNGGGFTGFANASFGGLGGFHVAPFYDVLMATADLNLKQRVLRSDLTYKLTAGPEGTRLLHLFNVPDSKTTFGGGYNLTGRFSLVGCKVWYFYYDTNTAEEAEKCRSENRDVIDSPNDIPLDSLPFSELNSPAKNWVKKFFIALTKESLGRVRGKFSGSIKIPDNEVTLDSDALLAESKEEKEQLRSKLFEGLERFNRDKMLERKANEAENLNKSLNYVPLGFYII